MSKDCNAQQVLERLNKYIDLGMSRDFHTVCNELSIFDWWPSRLTITHMKQMRTFLKTAIKLGYTGYVCFKVGASGCANGMWAHKNESTDGYSPDGDAIYRSFSPDYTYWQYNKNGEWYPDEDSNGKPYDSLKTAKMLEQALTA